MSLASLQEIGITETEAKLYELLLKLGEVPITTLIRESKMKRPTVYKAVHSLTSKDLVHQRDIRKKLHVRPESPSKLQEIADRKYKEIEQTKASLTALLPGLALSYANSTDKPVVRVYEGLEGLKEIYLDTIKENQPVSAILQASIVEPELYDWLNNVYVKKRLKAKMHAKVIMDSGSASKDYIEKSKNSYRTVKVVDQKRFPFQHEVDIYGDKVAFIHYRKDEPLIGIIIHHPQITKTMRAWFDLTWESLA